jgi:hypothetical protein
LLDYCARLVHPLDFFHHRGSSGLVHLPPPLHLHHDIVWAHHLRVLLAQGRLKLLNLVRRIAIPSPMALESTKYVTERYNSIAREAPLDLDDGWCHM